MTKPKINTERIAIEFDQLAEIGATVDGGVSRLALSNEDLEARAWLADRFMEAGLDVHDDDAGNLSGIHRCPDPNARTLLIGSHLDSVPNGGRYDGTVGILAGLEAARAIREADFELPFHLEVINFTDEEGCWQSLFGSRALTGTLNENFNSDSKKDNGPFRAALFRAGIRPSDIHLAKRRSEDLVGYLELHIEQSYVLHKNACQIGVVTGIVGRETYRIAFKGESSHSGTTRALDRRDALRAGANFIAQAHRMIESEFPAGILNCANIVSKPGAFNIIPSQAEVTVECRHADKDLLRAMEMALLDLAHAIAFEHQVDAKMIAISQMPAARMAGSMVLAIEKACRNVSVNMMRLTSFAGHDAQIMSNFTPAGMLFIPSVDGISHSPREFTVWGDVLTGTDVLLETILQVAQQPT
jgi:beta-ureidopropionase / N-carbamoyl-L-amino-acid hydrolase